MAGFPLLLILEFILLCLYIPLVILLVYILVKYYDVDVKLAKKIAWRFQSVHLLIIFPVIWLIAYGIQYGFSAWEPLLLNSVSNKIYATTIQSAWHVYERGWVFPLSGLFLIIMSFLTSNIYRKWMLNKHLPDFNYSKIKQIGFLSHIMDYIFIISSWAILASMFISA